MLGLTDKIRSEFSNGDAVTVSDLYSKYLVGIDSEKTLDVKRDQFHRDGGAASISGLEKIITSFDAEKLKTLTDHGKEFDYFLQTGLMIKSNYRDLHLFTMLMHRVHSIVDDKKQFVMAFPNKTAILPFRRILNWRQLYQFHIRQYHKTGRQDQTYTNPNIFYY